MYPFSKSLVHALGLPEKIFQKKINSLQTKPVFYSAKIKKLSNFFPLCGILTKQL